MEIQGYENYLIYENGDIKNKKTGRILKHIDGIYLGVSLRKNNKQKTFRIHRLLGLAFIPNPNNYYSIDHIDKNKHNNSLDNLRWADRDTQMNNRTIKTNTGYDNICLSNSGYYIIYKKKMFKSYLHCSKYTLQDAIKLRDNLLGV